MKLKIVLIVLIAAVMVCGGFSVYYFYLQRQEPGILVIDSFEGNLAGGENATVDYGSGAGAKLDVSPAIEPVYHKRQSLEIDYDVSGGGYMWVARGYNLTQKNAAQWKVRPEKINWDKYDTFVFYLFGEASGNDIAVDLIDSGKEYWRFLVKDDARGWKEIAIPLGSFSPRTDWQPDSAQRNHKMDFPIMAFQFEPKTGKGIIFVDKVCLREKEK